MGYKQELNRSFTLFNNAGVGFSLLSPLTALTGTYGSWGLLYGGPVVMMWGMPVVTFFSLLVAVSLAEMSSAYPTSGAIYYWSWVMAPPRFKAVACWVSGWVLVLGQASFTAANCRIFTDLLTAFVLLATGTALSSGAQLGIFLAVLVLSAALASCPNGVTAFVASLTALWNAIALAALAVALPALARRRQPLSYVFTHWRDAAAATGVKSHFYNLLLGLLISQYLYLGFDACAHIAEETHHADVNAPRGMLLAAAATALGGYVYLLALNLVATDPAALLAAGGAGGGGGPRSSQAVAQLFWNVHKEAYGSGRGGLALLTIPLLAALMCTHMCVAATARMLFAFSRDGAVPLHRWVARVEVRGTRSPVGAVWLMAGLAAAVGSPMFFAARYVATLETMAVVNTYLAYGAPLALKLLSGRGAFLPGPFYTGPRLSCLINAAALVWIAVIAVIFSLPTLYPITPANMNYNAAGTALVLLASLAAFYCPGVGGRHWFTGPRPNLGQFGDTVPLMQQQGKQQGQQQGQEEPADRGLSSLSASVQRTDTQTTTGGGGGGGGGVDGDGGGGGGASGGMGAEMFNLQQQQQQQTQPHPHSHQLQQQEGQRLLQPRHPGGQQGQGQGQQWLPQQWAQQQQQRGDREPLPPQGGGNGNGNGNRRVAATATAATAAGCTGADSKGGRGGGGCESAGRGGGGRPEPALAC